VLLYFKVLHANPTTVALTFLLSTLLIAATWGLRYAIFTSIAATFCFNFFFLPPVGTLTIADTQNWIALIAFLATAVIGSHLSERARREASEARRRSAEIERLYSFSQQLLLYDNPRSLLKNAPKAVVDTFGSVDAALYLSHPDKMYRYGDAHTIPADIMKDAARRGEPFCDPEGKFYIGPVRMGIKAIGSIAVAGEKLSTNTMEAIGSLLASAVERANAVDSLAHAEASRESERLRSALLDSITHELRTPLTSIKASISSLRSDFEMNADDKTELLAIIEEETDRLNRLVGEAVEMAQLDARQVHLDLASHSIRDAVDSALRNARWVTQRHKVEVRMAEGIPNARMDLEWITKVIQHLLENAAKYSEDGSPIFISAEMKDGRIVTSIADRGVGIDDLERSMVFDKFYRGQSQRYRVQGTGMGLAIVKAIVEAHEGSIDVTSQLGHGSVFTVSLPATT
jgi:two-component system sensor histidine kinase KdpD